jgi:hypothetical protein
MKIELIPYKGWKNNLRLSNGIVELIVTLDVGPRIISYRLAGQKNVFKEFKEQLGKSGEKEWQMRGGHRLWVAPEDLTRTYALDNGPVSYKQIKPNIVRVTPKPETKYGIQKELEIQLSTNESEVTIIHRVKNVGKKTTELAAWASSVMAPGGVEIIPLPAKKPHPGPPKNAHSPKDYAPNQQMIIWPYTDFSDGRWQFDNNYIILQQNKKLGPTKIGLAHRMGWVAYLNKDILFVKYISYEAGKNYPDNGCNFATFTNQEMLEIESLGPLVKLAPGKSVELIERWELFVE